MVQKWKNFADFSALLPSRSALTTGVKLIKYFAQICERHLGVSLQAPGLCNNAAVANVTI